MDVRQSNTMPLRGIELRYALTRSLFARGPLKVADLIDELARQGFRIDGRPTKTVSDALRWERRYGRVRRLGHGLYGPGSIPRATEHRIRMRVQALRSRSEVGT